MSTIAVFGGTGETGKEVVFQVSYCCPFSLLRVTHRSVVEQKDLGAIGEICLCGNGKITAHATGAQAGPEGGGTGSLAGQDEVRPQLFVGIYAWPRLVLIVKGTSRYGVQNPLWLGRR